MANTFSPDPASFTGMEYAGWQRNAASYDDLFGSVTRHAMEPLLDATGVRDGSSVLEVCRGPGYGAGAAAARGVRAIGIDFAPLSKGVAECNVPGDSWALYGYR